MMAPRMPEKLCPLRPGASARLHGATARVPRRQRGLLRRGVVDLHVVVQVVPEFLAEALAALLVVDRHEEHHLEHEERHLEHVDAEGQQVHGDVLEDRHQEEDVNEEGS